MKMTTTEEWKSLLSDPYWTVRLSEGEVSLPKILDPIVNSLSVKYKLLLPTFPQKRVSFWCQIINNKCKTAGFFERLQLGSYPRYFLQLGCALKTRKTPCILMSPVSLNVRVIFFPLVPEAQLNLTVAVLPPMEADDFVTIAKHKLLRRKSVRMVVPEEIEKTIYELTKEQLDHVEVKTPEQIEKERRLKEAEEEALRKRLLREEQERLRLIQEEKERREREEAERLRLIQEEEERKRREEEERLRVEREAQEKREALERQRQEAEERARRERKEDYDRKLAAVMNASNQSERENALREVGKLTIADFGSLEEWESHQREVGKLNILEIAGNFKKAGKRKFRKDRRKTQSVNWSNAKSLISKFSDKYSQDEVTKDEVIRFVKPTAVDLNDIGYNDSCSTPDARSDIATPDSGVVALSENWPDPILISSMRTVVRALA
eukprot:sb/3464808/